jgi:hypothetical protein
LDLINQLDVKNFTYKQGNPLIASDHNHIGIMAQQLEQLDPDSVVNVPNQVLGTAKMVRLDRLNFIMLKAIQDLSKQVDELKAQLTLQETTDEIAPNDYITVHDIDYQCASAGEGQASQAGSARETDRIIPRGLAAVERISVAATRTTGTARSAQPGSGSSAGEI